MQRVQQPWAWVIGECLWDSTKIELEKEGLLVENQVYLPIVYGGVHHSQGL